MAWVIHQRRLPRQTPIRKSQRGFIHIQPFSLNIRRLVRGRGSLDQGTLLCRVLSLKPTPMYRRVWEEGVSASNCYDRTCRPLEPIFGSTVQGMLLRQCSLQLLPPSYYYCYYFCFLLLYMALLLLWEVSSCVIALLCTSGPKHPSILQTQLEREQSPYKGVGQVQALNEAVHVARVVPWWFAARFGNMATPSPTPRLLLLLLRLRLRLRLRLLTTTTASTSRRPPPPPLPTTPPPPPHTPLTHIRFTRYLQYFSSCRNIL